ncbi:MAG: hypothetical protein K9I94_10925 [Bacteroidales bacterium]|nr:hypothetical protein [Bacteroidales bacterium]
MTAGTTVITDYFGGRIYRDGALSEISTGEGKIVKTGSSYEDYGKRFYDPAIARFPSVAPLAENYSFQSPYLYAYNNPVRFTDFLGMGGEDQFDEDEEGEANFEEEDIDRNHYDDTDLSGRSKYRGMRYITPNDRRQAQSTGNLGEVESSEGEKKKGNGQDDVEEGEGEDSDAASSGGDDLSLAGLYTHFQIGGGKALDINMSSVDFGGATQRDLGLVGMEAGDIRGVQLFRKNSLSIAGLAFGRVRMRAHGNNQFSIISDESARFDFAPLIDRAATLERNVGNVIGAGINYNVFLMPITPLTPVVPFIFGGPFDVNFHGTTTIPR